MLSLALALLLQAPVPPSPAPDYVHDGGPVLAPAERDSLNARIGALQRATGGDVGVAIVRDLSGRAPSDVALAIYRAWKLGLDERVGSARRDLGAVLLIVPKELAPDGRGECWVTTGYGAEGTLIDARAGAVCRDSVIPRLRERAYFAAVRAGVDGIGATFREATADAGAPGAVGAAGAAAARARAADDEDLHPGALALAWGAIVAGTAGGVTAVRRWRRRRPRPCPQGHGAMTMLDEAADDAALAHGQRIEEQVGSVDYDVWACPSCPERLVIPRHKWWSGYQACPRCFARTVQVTSRQLVAPTMVAGGLEETTARCLACAWRDVTRRELPRITPSSGGGGGSFGGGASFGGGGGGFSGGGFGGSGRSGGGGGGASY